MFTLVAFQNSMRQCPAPEPMAVTWMARFAEGMPGYANAYLPVVPGVTVFSRPALFQLRTSAAFTSTEP